MKAIAVLKKLRGLKITMLFEEKSLNPQIIKEIDEALEELEAYKAKIYELKQYNSSQMCKKCAYKDANDNLNALYCNSCFRNYVDNFEELTPCK